MLDLVWLIPALPLAGFLLLMVFGRRLGEPAAGWLASAAVGLSFIVSLVVFAGLLAKPGDDRQFTQILFQWIPVGNLRVDVGFLVDPLSITMVLFVTGIATLIHVYSIGYMHKDEKFSKFFIYMNMFVFSMLILVLADNLVLTFVGWEGVGACSYFLISFWFTQEANAVAGKKAFVTNRIGDFGFMLGTFLTFAALGTVELPRDRCQGVDARDGHRDVDRAAVLPRRCGQVSPAAALGVVTRRDGGPDARLGPDPRRDHGHRGRLPALPPLADPQRDQHRAERHHRRRRDHCALGGDGRLRAARHKTRPSRTRP